MGHLLQGAGIQKQEGKLDQIVIIGGGSSIEEGISKNLWQRLENKWTIGCNSAFNFITPTVLTFVDNHQFYELFKPRLKDLPLIIGKHYDDIAEYKWPNTYLLNETRLFSQDLSEGVYSGSLCGLFSLTLACHFTEDVEIFLLGFDFGAIGKDGAKDKTHFYQNDKNVQHTGIGYVGFYMVDKTVELFQPYTSWEKKKIYNVSINSKIPYFEKITYDEFFSKLHMEYDQEERRSFMLKNLEDYILC